MTAKNPARLLLVEARRRPGLGETNCEPFPFIAGFLEARGSPSLWVTFPPAAWAAGPNPFHLDLDARAREALVTRAGALGATHLLLSEAPSPSLRRFLARALPGLKVGHTAARTDFYDAGWLTRWLGAGKEEAGYLPDLAAPRYRGVAAGRDGSPPPPTPVVGSTQCFYAADLADNPAYRGVDLTGIARKFACSFCPGPADLKYRYRTAPIDLALAQIKGVQEEPRAVWSRKEFVVRSASLFFAMSKLLERLESERIPPVELYFSGRADEVVSRAADISKALALARRLGHVIHIFSMGAENLSAAENARLNKGLGLADIRAALARLRAWEREYPETFFFTRHGGLGFILFTPWTTLEDLRTNLDAARTLGLKEDGFLLTRRLMLFADMPVTRLAERDGLVDPAEPEARALFAWLQAHCDPGCRHFHAERDRPWRFRDPRTARVCALAVRLAKTDAVVAGDPYHGRLAAAAAACGIRLLDAFTLLLTLAEKRPDAGLDALCAEFLGLLSRLPARGPRRDAA